MPTPTQGVATVGLRLNPYYLLIHNIFASFPWAKLVVRESFGSLTLGGDLHLGDNRLTTLPESFPRQNSKLVKDVHLFFCEPPEEGTHPSQAVCQMTSITKSRDEEIPRRIMRYMDQHSIRVSAWLLCTLIIVSYEFMAYVKLPITGIGMGSAIGTSPLIMSSMVYGVSTVEFKLEAEKGVKLKLDFGFTVAYAIFWHMHNTSTSRFGAMEWIDVGILIAFTLLVRYLDLFVSGLSRNWISLIHANVCIHCVIDLSSRVSVGGMDSVAIGVGLWVAALLVYTCDRSVLFSNSRHKNNNTSHSIPWFYNGTTSLVYADTFGSAIAPALQPFIENATPLGLMISMAIKCAAVVFFEFQLPQMQSRDAKGVINAMQSQSYAIQGWRKNNSSTERHLDGIINRSSSMRVLVMLIMKLSNLSGTLILVEQMKAFRFRQVGKVTMKKVRLFLISLTTPKLPP